MTGDPVLPGSNGSRAGHLLPRPRCSSLTIFYSRFLVDVNFPQVVISPHLIVAFDSFTGELRGLYDSDFTTNGGLSLCSFDQDFWENED